MTTNPAHIARLAKMSTEELRSFIAVGNDNYCNLSDVEMERRQRYFPMIIAELERRGG